MTVSAVRVVGPLLLAVALTTGCGEDGGSGDQSPGPPAGTGPTTGPEVVEILSATAAGGTEDRDAIRLDGPGDGIDRLTSDLTRPQLERDVRRVVRKAEVPEGQALVGAIVSIGCDVPSGIEVTGGDEGPLRLKPVWTGVRRLPECFAPVTSIGLVLVDERAVELPL